MPELPVVAGSPTPPAPLAPRAGMPERTPTPAPVAEAAAPATPPAPPPPDAPATIPAPAPVPARRRCLADHLFFGGGEN